MNKNRLNLKLLLLVIPIFFSLKSINAQVSIGTTVPPVKGALLEVKNKEAVNPGSVTDENNVTSDKGGLGLPRVSLVNKNTLEPFILTTDTEWTNAITLKTKEKHAGLTVYNISETAIGETDANKIFYKGIYVWDGNQWYSITDASRFFYMPAFNLPMNSITLAGDPKPTYDLYAEYKKQFTKGGNSLFVSNNSGIANIPSPESDKLYSSRELDYVVTHYDDTVIKINSISADGVMEYEVKDTDPLPTSFVNVLFIIK